MVINVLQVILVIFVVLMVFNLMIIVHEVGHFLAAKWRGLLVDRFGVWFGKPIWKKKIGGVTYSLGSIPAGGFVSLPQMLPMEALEGGIEVDGKKLEDLPPVSPLDKIIVAFAGPLFSMLLAFAFAGIVWLIGKPVDDSELTTQIGYVLQGSPAEAAGLMAGDIVKKVDGKPVSRFSSNINDSITWNVITSSGDTIAFDILRNGKPMSLNVAPHIGDSKLYERKKLRSVGIAPAEKCIAGEIFPHSPADRAGMQVLDQVIAVDDQPVYHRSAVSDYIEANREKALKLTILRQGKRYDFTVKAELPLQGSERPLVGIYWEPLRWDRLEHIAPWKQITSSLLAMKSTLGAIFSKRVDVGPQHLSGPVGIMNLYYLLFMTDDGWRMALWFSVLLNVNLAVLNLLPFPVLDGGHITMAILEAIRKKPFNIKALEILQSACAFALIGFMLYVTFFDVQDVANIQSGNESQEKSVPIIFSPEAGNP